MRLTRRSKSTPAPTAAVDCDSAAAALPDAEEATTEPRPHAVPDLLYDNALSHPRPAAGLSIPFATAPATSGPDSVATARRLIAAYRATTAQPDTPLKSITDTDLWTGITRQNFSEMVGFLENDEPERLAAFLCEFGSSYTWFGGITTGIDGYNHWDTAESSVAYSYLDKLVCLAESLGVLPAENPEQGVDGNWGKNIATPVDTIVERISATLGIDIVPPMGVIPVAGLQTSRGLLHYRHINSLYLAARIRDLTDPSDRVCEFGAGLGIVAYYLNLMGRRDTTLFDIPLTNVLSGFFLIGALGPEAVCLEGESLHTEAVKIRANWNCVDVPDGHFRVSANQDSFPEINRQTLDEYVQQIARFTTGNFLSINHEVEHQIDASASHQNVSKMLAEDPRFQRLSRTPYWLRRGYVEELYRIMPGSSR